MLRAFHARRMSSRCEEAELRSVGEDVRLDVCGLSVLPGVLCRVMLAVGVRASIPSDDSTLRMAVVLKSFFGVEKADRGGIGFCTEGDLKADELGVVGLSERFNEEGAIFARLRGCSEA